MDLVEVASWRSARARADLALAPGERFVAGGTWLFSEPQPGTTGLVDLTTMGWQPWRVDGDGDLHLAATCTVAELLAVPADRLGGAADLGRACADAFVMSSKVQHTATLGGNVCLALPAGAMTTLLVALDAVAVVWATGDPRAQVDGERRVPVAELVTGVRTTALGPGEVLRGFEVPAASLAVPHVLRRQSLAAYGRSGAVVTASPGRLCLTAATTRPVVIDTGRAGWRDRLGEVDCWHADAHGAVDWRRAMTGRLADEAVAEVSRLTGTGAAS